MKKIHQRALVLLFLALASCAVLEQLGLWKGPLRFSHKEHGVQEGLNCNNCHWKTAEGDDAGMPAWAQCVLCHRAKDAEKPPERHAKNFFVDGQLQAHWVADISEEVKFSHQRHGKDDITCNDCHGEVESNTKIGEEMRVSKEECIDCHAGRKLDLSCTACHTQVSTEWEPPSHQRSWKTLHGGVVRSESPEPAANCALCHQPSTCTTCHQDEQPGDHTIYFRTQGHGIASSIDRQRCAVCHQQDTCESCHAEAAPRSHQGTWGVPREDHCFSCHVPLQDEQCFVCHKGSPSHLLAVPKPSTPEHDPILHCRNCHLAGNMPPKPALPHADNGGDCNICHR